MTLTLELGEDVGLLDLATEPLESALERLTFADLYFCHPGVPPSLSGVSGIG
jgi:hypothetical protein